VQLSTVSRSQAEAGRDAPHDHAYDGTPPTSLEEALKDDVLLVHTAEGKRCGRARRAGARHHSTALRRWKSQVDHRIELLTRDRLGFWELRGYSNTAHPWRRSLLLGVLFASSGQAKARQTCSEYVHEKLLQDRSLDAGMRQAIESAIKERFAKLRLQRREAGKKPEDARRSCTSFPRACSTGPTRPGSPRWASRHIGHLAGAPADAVDGIALYGYQKKIPADSIATWANGYRDGTVGACPATHGGRDPRGMLAAGRMRRSRS